MAKRISFKVEGEVQGVNFRNFTIKQAKSTGVTGYVQNASDGSVKGEAQGSEKALDEFCSHLNKGPPAAKVTKVEHEELDAKDEETEFVRKKTGA